MSTVFLAIGAVLVGFALAVMIDANGLAERVATALRRERRPDGSGLEVRATAAQVKLCAVAVLFLGGLWLYAGLRG